MRASNLIQSEAWFGIIDTTLTIMSSSEISRKSGTTLYVMCNETRFWLASQITEKREIKDARMVLAEARNMAKVRPLAVVTDGLRSYEHAITKEFHTMKAPRTEYIRVPNIRNRSNNNMVERLNGTVRERNKVMRGLDEEKTAQTIIDGFRIYYNFIRPHMALNGKTPAEIADLNLELGKNKWKSLIRKATLIHQ